MPDRFHPPLSTETFSRLKSRPPLVSNRGRITQSFFVSGGEERPKLQYSIQRTSRGDRDGTYIYEVRLDLDGFSLGERALPSALEGVEVVDRLPVKVVAERSVLLDAFIPDHLGFEPTPTDLVKARRREPKRKRRDVGTTRRSSVRTTALCS